MARLFGTIAGSKGTASRTGTELLRARLATWHGAVVVTLDDHGTWTVHTEPADPHEAGRAVPVMIAAGNVHTGTSTYQPGSLTDYRTRAGADGRRPAQSPNRRPPAGWTPFTLDQRSPTR